MKYIMMETTEGQKLPFIFPEAVTHLFMAVGMKQLILATMKAEASVVSAGFVNLGTEVEVHGESESLGGLPHNPADAARIVIGESVSFMPDCMVAAMLEKLK